MAFSSADILLNEFCACDSDVNGVDIVDGVCGAVRCFFSLHLMQAGALRKTATPITMSKKSKTEFMVEAMEPHVALNNKEPTSAQVKQTHDLHRGAVEMTLQQLLSWRGSSSPTGFSTSCT